MGQLVQSGLGFLLTALKQDPNAHVKDTTAWTIGAGCGVGLGCGCRREGWFMAETGWELSRQDDIQLHQHARQCGLRDYRMQMPSAPPVVLPRPCGSDSFAVHVPPLVGRIFEFVHGEDSQAPLLGPGNLPQVVEALLQAIRDAPHIAEKVRLRHGVYCKWGTPVPCQPQLSRAAA